MMSVRIRRNLTMTPNSPWFFITAFAVAVLIGAVMIFVIHRTTEPRDSDGR